MVPVIIGARKNAVIAQLSTERARTAGLLEPHKARIANFERSMQRLAAHWARKLEVDARECEHAARLRHSKQKGSFDQSGNLAKAIAARKAEIERINRVLDNLPSPGTRGTYGRPIKVSQNAVRNLIQRRIEHEAALAELEREEARLNAFDAHVPEQQSDSLGQAQQTSGNQSNTDEPAHKVLKQELKTTDQGEGGLLQNRPTARVQTVAPGVAQVSLLT